MGPWKVTEFQCQTWAGLLKSRTAVLRGAVSCFRELSVKLPYWILYTGKPLPAHNKENDPSHHHLAWGSKHYGTNTSWKPPGDENFVATWPAVKITNCNWAKRKKKEEEDANSTEEEREMSSFLRSFIKEDRTTGEFYFGPCPHTDFGLFMLCERRNRDAVQAWRQTAEFLSLAACDFACCSATS